MRCAGRRAGPVRSSDARTPHQSPGSGRPGRAGGGRRRRSATRRRCACPPCSPPSSESGRSADSTCPPGPRPWCAHPRRASPSACRRRPAGPSPSGSRPSSPTAGCPEAEVDPGAVAEPVVVRAYRREKRRVAGEGRRAVVDPQVDKLRRRSRLVTACVSDPGGEKRREGCECQAVHLGSLATTFVGIPFPDGASAQDFDLVRPDRRPAAGDRVARRRASSGRALPDAPRRDRDREDRDDGLDHRAGPEARRS